MRGTYRRYVDKDKINKKALTVDPETERLAEIMSLSGELEAVHARIHRVLRERGRRKSPEEATSAELEEIAEQISKVIGGMRDGVVKAKSRPIGPALARLPATAERAAAERGREARLTVEGGETELDRDLLDGLEESLAELIAFVAGGGSDRSPERARSGKLPYLELRLSAAIENHMPVLRLDADGEGFEAEWTEERARERTGGLLEWLRRSKGWIGAEPNRSGGTTIRLQFPRSAEMFYGLIVKLRSQFYLVPMSNVVEIAEAEPGEVVRENGKDTVGPGERRLPLVWLHALCRIPRVAEAEERIPYVVAGSAEKRFALAVDEVLWGLELRMEPFGPFVGRTAGIAGVAALPGGKPGLVLQVEELLELAGLADGT